MLAKKIASALSAVERRASPFSLLLAASWKLVYSDRETYEKSLFFKKRILELKGRYSIF